MIVKLAQKITDALCKRDIIQDSDSETYYFCFEILLSAILFWGITFSLALVSGQLVESLLYMATFTLMRSVAGGYHANSHWRCLSLSFASFLAFLAIEILWPKQWLSAAVLIFSFYAGCAIIRFAPVDHPNNPFTEVEWFRNRKKSLRYLAAYFVCTLLLTIAGEKHLAFCVAFGMFQVAVALKGAVHFRQGGEKRDKCMAESADSIG